MESDVTAGPSSCSKSNSPHPDSHRRRPCRSRPFLHVSKALFKEMFNILKLRWLKPGQADQDATPREFLQQENTGARRNARCWNAFFLFPQIGQPYQFAAIRHILLPTTRGLRHYHRTCNCITDDILGFLRTWTGSDSIKWVLLSRNAKKKTSFP